MLGPQQVPVQAVMAPSQQTGFPPLCSSESCRRGTSAIAAGCTRGARGSQALGKDLYFTIWRCIVYIVQTKL